MSHHRRTFRTATTAALALVAIAPAAASARFDNNPVYFHPTGPAPAVRVVHASGGFDWGDAGIGAAGGAGVSLLAIAGAAGMASRRRRTAGPARVGERHSAEPLAIAAGAVPPQGRRSARWSEMVAGTGNPPCRPPHLPPRPDARRASRTHRSSRPAPTNTAPSPTSRGTRQPETRHERPKQFASGTHRQTRPGLGESESNVSPSAAKLVARYYTPFTRKE